jgi:hypothetical protein
MLRYLPKAQAPVGRDHWAHFAALDPLNPGRRRELSCQDANMADQI